MFAQIINLICKQHQTKFWIFCTYSICWENWNCIILSLDIFGFLNWYVPFNSVFKVVYPTSPCPLWWTGYLIIGFFYRYPANITSLPDLVDHHHHHHLHLHHQSYDGEDVVCAIAWVYYTAVVYTTLPKCQCRSFDVEEVTILLLYTRHPSAIIYIYKFFYRL